MLRGIRRFLRSWFRDSRRRGVLSLDWWRSLLPLWMTPGFYWLIISYPFRWFFAAWHERRLRHLLWGLPAVLLMIVLALVFHRLRQQAASISYVYWEDAQAAIREQQYPRAEMLLDRILQENTAHVDDARYGLATVYEATGNKARAESLFNALAPDNARGHAIAHQRLAMLLSESISPASSPEELKRLKWHLEVASNLETPEMCLAWGRYCVAIQDLQGARRYLEKAAAQFPELWMTIGEVDARMGNNLLAQASYDRARQYLADQLKTGDNPRLTRVDYATVLMRLGRLDEARVVLEEGLQSDPEGDWHKLLAALYVNYHDLLYTQGGQPLGKLLEPIARSLEHEPNFGPALNRLMAYVNSGAGGNAELKQVLARVVAEGKEPALPHLALGNLCWLEQDLEGAAFHFERAIAINPKLAVVMNNLAWLLAHDLQRPDLERALALVNSALQERPDDPSFLDTRGTIFMKMGKSKEALNDLEKALKGVLDPAAVHAKLAQIYEELGRTEMSEQHRQLEQELRDRAAAAEAEKQS